jgi:purine-nucleoside phosphorylase
VSGAPGTLLAQIAEAVAHVRSRTGLHPSIGLVLGSGLGAFARSLERPTVIPYAEIPHFPRSTAIGHAGELVVGHSHGVPVAVMSGRPHFYEGHSPQAVVFPVRVLGRLGVKILVMTNAAGSVNVNYKPGELMVVEDHINLMGFNPLVGPNEESLGERFFDMSEAYDPALREIAEKACWKAGVTVRKGIYLAVSGPSYETPAEIRAYRAVGADAVGMSTVPEAIALRHAGVRVLGISTITNMAAGILPKPLVHEEVLQTTKRVADRFRRLLVDLVPRVAKAVGS